MATYNYGGHVGLSAPELFFWVTVDSAMEHLGLDDVVAMAAIISGQPIIPTRGKFAGATRGTSPASLALSRTLNVRLPFRLPTLTGASLRTLRVSFTNNLGRFAGRTVPVLGWAWLAYDVSQILWKAVNKYNQLAAREDRLW
jgi:hypothetical protein